MSEPFSVLLHPTDHDLARLYRLQVRELEEFAMFLQTPNGRITSWNRGIEKTFGYPEEEWLGQEAGLIFTDEDRASGIPAQEIRTAAEQGVSSNVRWHQRKDGSRVYMTGILKALRDEAGTLLGYSKVFFDDTPRKLLEDALTQSNHDLQQFAFVASHDLQEPLRTLSNFAIMLRQRYRGQFDESADKILGFLVEASERLGTLTGDLLAYSQLAQGDRHATSVHLDEDLETAISLLHTSIEQTGAVITHDPLPSVALDRNQMVRLFQNLLSNALKFRQPNTPPRIHISAERQGNEWLLRVVDNGIGFPPEQAQAIFAPFKRLHSTRTYPGSGIGLAACQRIVENYGGRIGAEGQEGKGATFWFTVPAQEPEP